MASQSSKTNRTKEPPLLSSLRNVDPYRFEHFISDVWSQLGYRTTVTDESQDMGVDVIAEKRRSGNLSEKIAIQVKRFNKSNTIGSPKIQQYSSLRMQENADEVIVVSTGYFTDPAYEAAKKLGVRLVNGQDLCSIVNGLNSTDKLLDDYFNAPPDTSSSLIGGLLGGNTTKNSRSILRRLVVGAIGIYGTVGVAALALQMANISYPNIIDEYLIFDLLNADLPVPGSLTWVFTIVALGCVLFSDPASRWKAVGILTLSLLIIPFIGAFAGIDILILTFLLSWLSLPAVVITYSIRSTN